VCALDGRVGDTFVGTFDAQHSSVRERIESDAVWDGRAGYWTRGAKAASSPIIWLVLTISLSRNTLHEKPRLAA
jgi:hypothetical protein